MELKDLRSKAYIGAYLFVDSALGTQTMACAFAIDRGWNFHQTHYYIVLKHPDALCMPIQSIDGVAQRKRWSQDPKTRLITLDWLSISTENHRVSALCPPSEF